MLLLNHAEAHYLDALAALRERPWSPTARCRYRVALALLKGAVREVAA